MLTIDARNVHQALPRGLRLLQQEGISRHSRAGLVVQAPEQVATVYRVPAERVVLWPQRDFNVAFALYEALWMLAGRDDTAPLDRYIRDYTARFSDDGQHQHGAYGRRWRRWFSTEEAANADQLAIIARRLRADPDDRRAVLQMWDTDFDLDRSGKDVPCNLAATLQVSPRGSLDLTVFCRSNDVLKGAYFANAFHFSLLLEYLARWAGFPVGTYTQVSVNYHLYKEELEKAMRIPHGDGAVGLMDGRPSCPYTSGAVRPTALPEDHGEADQVIQYLLSFADSLALGQPCTWSPSGHSFCRVGEVVLWAHEQWRARQGPDRFTAGMLALQPLREYDLAEAMFQWLARRKDAWLAKLVVEDIRP